MAEADHKLCQAASVFPAFFLVTMQTMQVIIKTVMIAERTAVIGTAMYTGK